MTPKPCASDVEQFRALVMTAIGLRFDDDKLPFLEDLLSARIRASGSESASAYLQTLRASPSETSALARVLTVSETYFFRNPDQFRAVEAILRDRAGAGRRLRLLSAGCSSGEEPFSLAMILRESLGQLGAGSVDIHGFDINPDAIDKARSGAYTTWSLRETPEHLRLRYFRENGRSFVVDDAVREMVRFEERNILRADPDFWYPGAFDIVLCRNLLMYLTPERAREVVERIAASLVPSGFLFLGHAENLRGLSREFHLHHEHGTFYYEKRAHRAEEARPAALRAPADSRLSFSRGSAPDASWVAAIAQASNRIAQLTRGGEERAAPPERPRTALAPVLELFAQERYQEALALLPRETDADGLLLRAVLLATSGDAGAAEPICAELLALDELNAGAHYVLALCREHAGDRDGAIEHDRVAVYLDSEFAMPHLHLGLLARRRGDLVIARRELELARGLLSREDPARIVLFGGGFGREALVELCRSELRACGGID